MAKQYVQHSSGQGEKWALHPDYTISNAYTIANAGEDGLVYTCYSGNPRQTELKLPRSEYVLCEPPVVWKDVTAECEIDEEGAICHRGGHTTMIRDGYRRRKISVVDWSKTNNEAWAIIIEQKVE